jgi:hypothetical protein
MAGMITLVPTSHKRERGWGREHGLFEEVGKTDDGADCAAPTALVELFVA